MKIICIGRNYVEHIKELGNKTPDNPVIFFKTQDSLSFKNEIKHPNFTKELHHEIELVYKISKGGKNIKKVKLKNYISEIGLGIDFTARDIQNSFKSKGLPWSFSKSCLISFFCGFISQTIDWCYIGLATVVWGYFYRN